MRCDAPPSSAPLRARAAARAAALALAFALTAALVGAAVFAPPGGASTVLAPAARAHAAPARPLTSARASDRDGPDALAARANTLVTATAQLALAATGLHGGASSRPGAALPVGRAQIRAFLAQAAHHTTHTAHTVRSAVVIRDAGILADPPTGDPLAYDELSAMMLGRA